MKHLPVISQMSLKRACLLKWNIYNIFWKRCCDVLDFLGFNGEYVMSILDKFESEYVFLSGGFILFCLSCMDDCFNFDGNDIDFYISDYNSCKFCQEIKHITTSGIVVNQVRCDYGNANNGILAIENIHFSKDTTYMMFQSILVDKLRRDDDILNSFDFDFCKNSFNADKLVVKKPFSVITKRCTISEHIILQDYVRMAVNERMLMFTTLKTLSRIEKYRERRFYVAVRGITEEHEEHETRTKDYITNVLIRLKKYSVSTDQIYKDWLLWKSKYYE